MTWFPMCPCLCVSLWCCMHCTTLIWETYLLHPNQHLPCSPDNKLQPILTLYFHLGMSDTDITTAVMDHFDHMLYGLSTRQQKHTVQSIAPYVEDIKKCFPNRGAETIRKALLMENKIHVPRPIISEYLRQTEPDAVDAQWYKRFKRRTFVAIGPNEMWSLDQHDKFKRYGLFFHVGLDPFPGVIHWCKVWWTVRNPKVIASFYLDTARSIGGIPLIMQSDPGTENVNVAYAQTALRHQMDPSLDGSIQHRWFHKHGNIKPKIHWSIFRRDWAIGFQVLLDKGVNNGYYDIGDPLECLLFRFVFILFIQREVDAWVNQRNWTKCRADRKKVLPNGIPMLVLHKPHKWKVADYKISIPSADFDEIKKKYAPPDDPIFELVPRAFAEQANVVWTAMGSPQLKFDNAWEIYLHMRDVLRAVTEPESLQQILSNLSTSCEPQNSPNEIPATLTPTIEEDDLLVMDDEDDEDLIPIVDLTASDEDSEDNDEGGMF
ncbi:hypothetical protein EI94DRAFT_1773974 [Lactarius quietus]|nr:hypothetical protein EI94DRAFT_1773974 [Lactarius quietus]